MRTIRKYTPIALSTFLPIMVSVGLLSASAAQAGKGQAPGQSEKVDVCHVNSNGKSKLLSLPLDAALGHLEHHDGADFFPTDGDCDKSNDCILGTTPSEITAGLYTRGFELIVAQEEEEVPVQFIFEVTNAAVVSPATCSIQADLRADILYLETGAILEYVDWQVLNYDFRALVEQLESLDTDSEIDILSDDQTNACVVTLGCD